MSEKWVAAIFKKFQARYGHKWTSAIEGIERMAVSEWSEGLAGYTADEIKEGLERWNNIWPPALPEFQKACRERSRFNQSHKEYLALPDPNAGLTKQQRVEHAEPFIEQMRRAISS